jgi:hypothetical protein
MAFLAQKRQFRPENATKNLQGRVVGEESPWLQPCSSVILDSLQKKSSRQRIDLAVVEKFLTIAIL